MPFQTNNTTPTNYGVVLTTPGSAHTKGSWVDLLNPTTIEAHTLCVGVMDTSLGGTNSSTLIDIGTGATPDIIINNIGLGWTGPPRYITFPVRIPSGTRIQARIQSARTSLDVQVWIALLGTTSWTMPWSSSTITTYGADTATSKGVNVTAGSGSKGSWTSIGTASQNHDELVFAVQGGADTTQGSQHFYWDVGTGAGPTMVFEDMPFWMENAEHASGPYPTWLQGVGVASGDSIQVRGGTTAATNLVEDFIAYGVTYTITPTGTRAQVLRHRTIRS